MKWFLFVLFLHTDKPAEIYRWEFASMEGCTHAAEFVTQGNQVKAACIQDGKLAYGSEVGVRNPLPNPVKEWTGPIEGETP